MSVEDVLKFKKYPEKQRVYRPVHDQKSYLFLLRKNYAYYNVEESRVDELEKALPHVPKIQKIKIPEESHIEYIDRVIVRLKCVGDTVRVRIIPDIADIYEKYYKKPKTPPVHKLVSAFHRHGYSDTYIENFVQRDDIRRAHCKKMEVAFDKIFNKTPVKMIKPKKEEKKVEEDAVEPDEEEEEVEEEHEDGAFEIEQDEEEPEEEYYSDGGED